MFTLTLICVLLVTITNGQSQSMESRLMARSVPARCRRTPPGVVPSKEAGTNGFSIKISGNPDKYLPGEYYTVTLQGLQSNMNIQKFIGFMLIAEPKESTGDYYARPYVGSFKLIGDAFTKFSEDCPNAIIHASPILKSEIQVMWMAPPAGSGCVLFKATIQDSKEQWYSEVGDLLKELCEEEQENQDEQPEIVAECCSCDEAKYEIGFEGLWARQTHPKAFPKDIWSTQFSEIIGASHSGEFRMWEYGGIATEGVRDLATVGMTKKLESELKKESNKIRTIIKARPLKHPDVNGKTFALFRVDKHHHLMSFLTRLAPSPDWIVGVSALELCLKNCSWINEKVMNLYPWDAGIDSGLTYVTTARTPTIPQEKIRRITSSNPNSEVSPFYDPTGAPMKPVAKLTVTRQRVYDKTCSEYNSFTSPTSLYPTDESAGKRECRVSEWSEFTACSVTCGQGIQMRTRHYFNQQIAELEKCSVPLVDRVSCDALCVGDVSCRTTEWGEWEECSVTCGKGLRRRSRKYLDYRARKSCALELMDKESCMGAKPFCETDDYKLEDPKCAVTQWSEWSPCPVTCGKGVIARTRLYLNVAAALTTCNVELIQKVPCTADRIDCNVINRPEAMKICQLPQDVGPCRGYFPRWYYDTSQAMCIQFIYGGCRGNRNNFERYAECKRMCESILRGGEVFIVTPSNEMPDSYTPPLLPFDHNIYDSAIDCEMTSWTEWGQCSQTCGYARRERTRMIKVNPENGGKPCPSKQVQRRKCKDNPPCREDALNY